MCEFPSPEETRRAGIPVRRTVLSDGNAWGFALPTARIRPVIKSGRADFVGLPSGDVAVAISYGYPFPVDGLLHELAASLRQDTLDSQYKAFFNLAAALLRRAHKIDQQAAYALLAVDLSDLPRLVNHVIRVVSTRPQFDGQESGPVDYV